MPPKNPVICEKISQWQTFLIMLWNFSWHVPDLWLLFSGLWQFWIRALHPTPVHRGRSVSSRGRSILWKGSRMCWRSSSESQGKCWCWGCKRATGEAEKKDHRRSREGIEQGIHQRDSSHGFHPFLGFKHTFFWSQLQKTQEKTKEVRQSAEKLSDKIKQAKDGFEEDLKATRGVVKELKDFLSGTQYVHPKGILGVGHLAFNSQF